MIEAMRSDLARGLAPAELSARFHNGLARWILQVAKRIGCRQVVLSGGVFQNAYLVEHAAALLESGGFQVYTHQRVPPNDGGIALGQAVIAGLRA